MAEGDSPLEDSSTSTFPALTTTFTPPPECTAWYIDECTDTTNCYVKAFPTGTGICGGDGSDSMTSYACYPTVTHSTGMFANGQAIYTLEVATYSPGLYCPLGMSTATSVPLLDGVFCCPSGMRFQGGLEGGTCARTQTEGVFILSGDCTRTTISKPTGSVTTTISIYAMPVFLGGQKLLNPSSSSTKFLTTSSSASIMPTPSSPESNDDNVGQSIGLKVGLVVGITAGVILIIALCAFGFVRRYRKRMAWKMKRYQKDGLEGITPVDSVEVDKPELAGSGFPPLYGKAELDPLATRAELEAPSEENGAGIFIRKPELPGSDPLTERGGLGVYVKRKGELEAFSAKLDASQDTAANKNVEEILGC